MDKMKYCRKCGKAVRYDAKFCRNCGAVQNNRSNAPSFSQPTNKENQVQDVLDNEINQKQKEIYSNNNKIKTVKKKRGIFVKVAAFLIIIFIGIAVKNILSDKPYKPGTLISNEKESSKSISEYVLSSVKISDNDLSVPAQSAYVSPEQPETVIDKVFINFSSCNLEGEKEVKVKKLSQKTDEQKGFTIQAYDFELEGISEFNTPVYIEMPYDPVIEDNLYEENTIFVQYYKREENRWVMIPSWIDAESNTVSILTNHFSTFGIFQDNEFDDVKKIAHLFQYSGEYKGPLTPVYTTGRNIERHYQYVDETIFQKYIDYKAVPVNDCASSFLNTMNHGTSAGGYYLTAVSPEMYKDTIKGLSNAGKLFVFSKITYQWYQGAATEDIIKDNFLNLFEIAMSSAGVALAAPEMTVVAAGIWLTGLTYDVGSVIYEHVTENEPRYLAYRLLSENGSVNYLPDEEICVLWRDINDTSYSNYDEELAKSKHKSIELYGEYGWAKAFNAIQKKYKENPVEMTKALERLLESYLDVFWYHYDIDTLMNYLKTTETGFIFKSTLYDEWEWPTEYEIQQYKANYRTKMKEFLRPVMKAMAQKSMLELNELTLQEVIKLWDLVNMEIDFEITDENLKAGEFFPSSPLSDMTINLSRLSEGTNPREWICAERKEKSNYVFGCNLYAYIKAGCPTNVEFYEKNEESGFSELVFSKEFALSKPTVISVDMKMEDINGIYRGKALGGNYVSGEEMDLYYQAIRIESNKEGILVGPCLENGDYDPDNLVQCTYNDSAKQYEGKARRESGNQWMELSFTAEIYETYKTPKAKVAYTQIISSRPGSLYIYEYDVEKTSALKGNPVGRSSEASENPVPSGGGSPVGGFTGPIIPQGD